MRSILVIMVEPSSADYKALVKKRSTYRKIVASSVNFIKKFDTKSKSCRQIKLRLDEIVKTMGNYDEVQTKIGEIDERPDVQDNERISFLDECNEVRSLMLDIIDEYEKSDMNNGRNSTELSSTSRDGGFVKLPAFPIPIFKGSLQDWPSFIDTFNAMFHENDKVPTVQKFQHLKSCLVESAADIVKTIPTTAENYMQAYEAVVSRYENKTLIVQSHIRSLFDTPKVEKTSAFNLRQLYHHVTSHVRSLKALGQLTQHWNAWLVTLVCSRLDNVTVGEWQLRQSSKELPRYSDIENYLAMRVAAFEAGEAANQQVLPVDKNNKLRQFGTGPNKVTEKRSLFTKSNDYVKCFICGEGHQINHCDEFLSMKIEDRKAAVFKFKLCYNCLRRNHQVHQCRSSSCTTCGKKHNNLLHQEFQNYTTSKPSTSCEVNQPASPQSAFVGITNSSLFTQSHTMVMLATVVVEVCDESGKMVQCRAVLDSGSQVNFVTNQCARRLGLFRVDAAVSVTGIGHSHAK